MSTETLNHLQSFVLPAAKDYISAERELSAANTQKDQDRNSWDIAHDNTLRMAGNLAIAIDGLTDRYALENHSRLNKEAIRSNLSGRCFWPGSDAPYKEAHDRIRAVANAFKHSKNSDSKLPIQSWRDVLVIGTAWGQGPYGVGKYGGGPETQVIDKDGKRWKFSGDALVAISAWYRFLRDEGVKLPPEPVTVLGRQVHP